MVYLVTLLRNRKFRFLLAGGYNTAFGYIAFAALYSLLGAALGPTHTLLISYVPSVTSAYFIHKYFVFRPWPSLTELEVESNQRDSPTKATNRFEFTRFVVANTLILAGNLAFLPLTIRYLGVSPLLAQAGFLLGSTLVGYFAHKEFSFRIESRP